jgi:hypothetical protein
MQHGPERTQAVTDVPSINDLLPCLMGERPALWEGTDAEFARWAHEAFNIPATIHLITITPRVVSGRAAIAIGGDDGAIVFVLISHHGRKQLEIKPHLMGPICKDATVLAKANTASTVGQIHEAVLGLVMRHLTPDVAMNLLLYQVH